MKEYRQNTRYADVTNEEEQAPEPETKESGGHGNRYSLPYGLCESVGIDTTGMTPREAWDAWTNKTGRTKEDAEREHWGKTAQMKKQPATPKELQTDNSHELKQEAPSIASETSQKEVEEESPKEHSFKATNYGVDEETARRANEAYSMWGYKSGSATARYNSSVSIFENNVNALIEQYKSNDALTEEDWAKVDEIAQRYSENLSKYTNESNRVEASYPSWFIAGPANYNTRKNDAKNNRLRKLYEDNKDRLDPNNNIYLKRIRDILSNTNIQSDDENAVGKLQKKYDTIKAEIENGKAMNAYFRKNGTLVGFSGISEEEARKFDERNKSGDYFSRQPYMPFTLQNRNAELRRLKGRIEQISQAKSAAETAASNPESVAAKYPKVDGVEVQENAEQMRVQLRFPGKPDETTRTLLKSHGFRWSPSQGAWQRQLNGNGTYAARQVMEQLSKNK